MRKVVKLMKITNIRYKLPRVSDTRVVKFLHKRNNLRLLLPSRSNSNSLISIRCHGQNIIFIQLKSTALALFWINEVASRLIVSATLCVVVAPSLSLTGVGGRGEQGEETTRKELNFSRGLRSHDHVMMAPSYS